METNNIYNMNCLDGLDELADGSVDLVVTDPPYAVGATSNGLKGSVTDNNLIIPFFKELVDKLKRVLKEGGELYMFTDWRTYPLIYPVLAQKLTVRNLIVWDYGWIKAGGHYRFRHEFIIYATNGVCKRKFSGSEPDVWQMKPVDFTKKRFHRAEKPVEVLKRMIGNSSCEGEVVLDCFLGSGSTAIACLEMDRRYIGFEIDEDNFKTAQDRIQAYIKDKESKISLFD